jgi:hypothetical protein
MELPAEARLALTRGQIVEAIRLLREREDLPLVEAKARIEAHIAADPVLKDQIERRRKDMRGRIVRWSLVIDAILVALALWWWFGRS